MSEIKVNKISPRTACGTTTLGDSGDTFTIPAGVTITNSGTAAGFGATGAASWDTTAKTTGFTAVDGVGYFVNTTAGAISVTLPLSPAAGAVIGVSDYAGTADTNNITLLRNGSNIAGVAADSTISTAGLAVTLVYVDVTRGWLVTDSGIQSDAPGPLFITATGGTISTVCTNYKVHTFTGPGTFTVCSAGNPAGSTTVDYMVVAGGAGGGGAITTGSGAGGAGGYRESPGTASGSYSVSPLGAAPAVALPVSVQGYAIAVGAGGAAGQGVTPGNGTPGCNGLASTFSSITSAGGGRGAREADAGGNGGSGGGGGGIGTGTPAGGCGNIPATTPAQGTNGGTGGANPKQGSGGGGGATVVGGAGSGSAGGAGGAGATSSINGTPTARAGGGGGSVYNGAAPDVGAGGAGGGGAGGYNIDGVNGTTNTGGGGGGTGGPPGGSLHDGGAGGSGIVVIRYKFQN